MSLYAVYISLTGLDYVGHEDVLPYTTTEKQPIHNHLFDKFIGQESETGIYDPHQNC